MLKRYRRTKKIIKDAPKYNQAYGGELGHVYSTILRVSVKFTTILIQYKNGQEIKFHVDHIIPYTKINEHKEFNLVQICVCCNMAKFDDFNEAFLKDHIEKENCELLRAM